MAANANLHKAKDAKNDEFYTQLTDVSKELMHYKQHSEDRGGCGVINGQRQYSRIFIRKKAGV